MITLAARCPKCVLIEYVQAVGSEVVDMLAAGFNASRGSPIRAQWSVNTSGKVEKSSTAVVLCEVD